MVKNLVVCCDGTGNVWKSSADKTNVVKLVESLVIDPARQIDYYDPGVGTPDGLSDELSYKAMIKRVAGLVWGAGVWTNVAEAYRFLITNYQRDDRIFLFGFSRGAFTARAVSGLVNLLGMLRPGMENLIPTALGIYRMKTSRPKHIKRRGEVAQLFRKCFGSSYGDVPIHFIGVWDTVESVGVAQLFLGTRITSDRSIKPRFLNVRHAVALDELRWPYTPRLYEGASQLSPSQTFKQVWVAGAHCDVGGGYATSGLAHAALHWMVREANHHGLLVDFKNLDGYQVDALAKLHDETLRLPPWMLVGASKREYPPHMTVHESVVQRMNAPRSDYRPPLPDDHDVEHTLTQVLPFEHNAAQASASTVPTTAVEWAVPPVSTSASPPAGSLPRQSIGIWWWVALPIAAGVTAWRLLGATADELALATLQSTQGWSGHLGEMLIRWQAEHGVSVGSLIAWDFLTIAGYTVCVAMATLLLSRVAGLNGYPGPRLGMLFRYSGGLLPLADILENVLTLLAMSAHLGNHCIWLPCSWTAAIASFLTSVSSWAKLAFAGGFVIACLVAVAMTALRAVRRA